MGYLLRMVGSSGKWLGMMGNGLEMVRNGGNDGEW